MFQSQTPQTQIIFADPKKGMNQHRNLQIKWQFLIIFSFWHLFDLVKNNKEIDPPGDYFKSAKNLVAKMPQIWSPRTEATQVEANENWKLS